MAASPGCERVHTTSSSSVTIGSKLPVAPRNCDVPGVIIWKARNDVIFVLESLRSASCWMGGSTSAARDVIGKNPSWGPGSGPLNLYPFVVDSRRRMHPTQQYGLDYLERCGYFRLRSALLSKTTRSPPFGVFQDWADTAWGQPSRCSPIYFSPGTTRLCHPKSSHSSPRILIFGPSRCSNRPSVTTAETAPHPWCNSVARNGSGWWASFTTSSRCYTDWSSIRVDSARLEFHDCKFKEVDEIIGPYIRDYFRRDPRFEDRLGVFGSPTSWSSPHACAVGVGRRVPGEMSLQNPSYVTFRVGVTEGLSLEGLFIGSFPKRGLSVSKRPS